MSCKSCTQTRLCLVTKLSKSSWNKLNLLWNKLLRVALHEKCPKHLPVNTLYELTGTCSIENFNHYLINLRTSKINHPEFKNWIWLDPKLLPEKAISFKKNVYRKINEIFIPIINNFNASNSG